jgi:hypothetical protein
MVWFVPAVTVGSGGGGASASNFTEVTYEIGEPNVSAGTPYALPTGASANAVGGSLVRNEMDNIPPTLYTWNKTSNTLTFMFNTDGLDSFVFVVQKFA